MAARIDSGEPVCLIHGGHEGLRVTEEGLRLLESLHEPVAVVCLAGQYRTGKSFFLNQLTRQSCSDADSTSPNVQQEVSSRSSDASPSPRFVKGFRVGPTTESCTRGVWLWDPKPTMRNARGERVLLMDTEGIASTDNDESYDAKIFSLGLLLSSLFVFNTMGVIDEGAIDRLFLVSELTKHVCVSANTSHQQSQGEKLPEATDDNDWSIDSDSNDEFQNSRQLAPHFPPFIWLLRDFTLEIQSDGTVLTPNEYLEKSLELREGNSRRNDERNRIRRSIRILFSKRECLTLVRPVMDENQLRNAAQLQPHELRPEFVEQMTGIRQRIWQIATPKQLFGQVMDGCKLAHLVKCYTETMNNGSIPDIKAAWAYVSDATNQNALTVAIDKYDNIMQMRLHLVKPSSPVDRKNLTDEDDGNGADHDGGSGGGADAGGAEDSTETEIHDENSTIIDQEDAEQSEAALAKRIVSQQEFEKVHKDAQDEALAIFKKQSVEGSSRQPCFQRLRLHIQRQKTNQISILQRLSTTFCTKLLARIHQELITTPLRDGVWDFKVENEDSDQKEPGVRIEFQFAKVLEQVVTAYDTQALGPAKKNVLFSFYQKRVGVFGDELKRVWRQQFCEALQRALSRYKQLEAKRREELAEAEKRYLQLHNEMDLLEMAKSQVVSENERKDQEIDQLETQGKQLDNQFQQTREKLAEEHMKLEKLQLQMEKEMEKLELRLANEQEKKQHMESSFATQKQQLVDETTSLHNTLSQEREARIKQLAAQAAEINVLQKQLAQKEKELVQKQTTIELLEKQQAQMSQWMEQQQAQAKKTEKELVKARDLNVAAEQRASELFAKQLHLEDTLERERENARQRIEKLQKQLGSAEIEAQVALVVQKLVFEVESQQENADKNVLLLEERNVLQERLGELYLKISTLPDFYQRQVFCAEEPVPNFFDAIAAITSE